MKSKFLSFVAALAAILGVHSAQAQTVVVSDTFNVTTVGTGFALTNGVNTGINPPTTRITGTAAANLRYLQTALTRSTNKYDINASRLRVSTEATIGRFTISGNGATAFDFGPALGAAYASPTNPAIYEIRISMRNDATSTARFSFGIATAEGDATTWDFGLQMYRTSGADFYTMQKRFDAASSPTQADVNAVMFPMQSGTTTAGGNGTLQSFLIRVTDAGAETSAYSSRIQVSTNNGVSWSYDTQTDPTDLGGSFRFDGPGRVIVFDQASNGSGNVFYDNFSITSINSPAPPSAVVWTGAGANNNWSTPENWGGTVPNTGQPIVFDGTTQQANVNDLVGFDTPSLTFNTGGFALTGNTFAIDTLVSNVAGINTIGLDLSFNGTAQKTWSIASGSEVLLNGTTTVEVNGDHGISGGGTLHEKGAFNIGATTANPAFSIFEGKHLIDGVAFSTRGGYRIGSQPTGIGGQTVITNGGNLSITATSGNLRVGDSANPNPARLDIDNSTLTLGGSVVLAVSYAAGATAIVNQNGGTVTAPTTSFSESGAGTGTYTIKNGTLSTRLIRKNNAGGNASIYFDNATLSTAPGASSAFFSGLNLAQIQAGGLNIDAQTDVVIAQPLSGPGGIVKSSFASATLTGANTYTGNTVVSAGKLALPTVQTNATTVQVFSGAEFGVSEQAFGSTLNVSALNFASSGTLSFDLGAFGTPSAPLMRVASLSVGGPITVNVANGLQLSPGQFVLVDYNGTISGGFQFQLGSLPPGVTATLVNNAANSSIDLNITGVPGYRWTGAVNGDWDGSTQNWIDLQTGSAAVYADGFPVEFRDGAATGNINIPGLPAPSIITVTNNTLPYVWSGNGGVTVGTIRKFGSNTLTRLESSFDTVTTYEINQGTLAVNNAFDTVFTTVLTDISGGTGIFAKQGASKLTINSTNSTYDGSVLIQQGTVKMSNDRSLGSTNAHVTIASGGTLDLNDFTPGFQPVTVSGAGTDGLGAIIDTTTAGAVGTNLRDVTLAGDTTFGGAAGRWDIRVRNSTGPGPGLRGNGFNLTKEGAGFVSIACQRDIGANTPYWDMNLGNIVINAGTLALAESLTVGNPSKTITINSGAAIQLFDLGLTNPLVRNISVTDGKINGGGASTDTNILNGAINIAGNVSVRPDQCFMVINGAISGSGSLGVSATDPGRLYLNGANTFAGAVNVTNGTFGGSGSITGNLVMQGGTLAPGRLDVLGTFTVGGTATLAGTNVMEINRAASPNSDRLNVAGTLTFGGQLKVVLGVGASSPQAGDVYQLFNKGSASSFSSIVLPDLSALPGGLSWDTSKLTVNGSISVAGTAVANPPTITSFSVTGTNFVFSGTGGTQGNNYVVLTSTNVAQPIANWTSIATNQFQAGGTFSVTNAITPGAPASFYELQVP